MTQAEQLLYDLSHAVDNAFISTWQTTDAWQSQLDAALEYLNELSKGNHAEVCVSNATQPKCKGKIAGSSPALGTT